MPLEAEFKTFGNEADFTSRFLVPLLRRLGHSIVAEYHGQREFGKDIVFGEIDRFDEIVYHGLQSKFQESIGQSDSEGLIEDCKQAFRHPFRHPTTGAEHRITSFVLANAGSIADNARENFFTAATNAEHGGAVKMLDGKALLALDRWATINRVEHVGEILAGLIVELRGNRGITEALLRSMYLYKMGAVGDGLATGTLGIPAERLTTDAVSHYLQRPILPTILDIGALHEYLTTARHRINDRVNMIFQQVFDQNERILLASEIHSSLQRIESISQTLEKAIIGAMSMLDPLAASWDNKQGMAK